MTHAELQALQTRTPALHRIYVLETGRDLPLTMQRRFIWEAWCAKGWSEIELRLVIAFIRRRIKQDRRRPESFRFENLIGDTSRFEEDLVDARAEARVPKVDHARQSALNAIGRPDQQPDRVRTAGEIAKAILPTDASIAEGWKKLKETLK